MTAARRTPLILGFSCIAAGIGAALLGAHLPGCGINDALPSRILPGGPAVQLTAAEVTGIITFAAAALSNQTMVIAVTDREGNILGLFRKTNAPATLPALLAGRFVFVNSNDLAVSLARTGAFFSNDQAPLSSTTVRFISREHFPPTFSFDGQVNGIKNTASGALWDIEATNRGCTLSTAYLPGQAIAPSRTVDGTAPGIGIATIPGGVPLYKFGKLVGGVGVCGAFSPAFGEFAAFSATLGFGPIVAEPKEIFIDGVRLPFVDQKTRPIGSAGDGAVLQSLASVGAFVAIPDLAVPGATITGTQGAPRNQVPEGWLVGPTGDANLSAGEVRYIIDNCIFRGNKTRAAIRLPLGARARFVIAVGGVDGTILGMFRMPDATVFSIDVAATKARNAAYFSSINRNFFDLPGVPPGTAVTARTLRFGSQPFYPPGIDTTPPGPFRSLLLVDQANPCTQGYQPPGPNQSGIVFFPGSSALYRGGLVLIGGLGVSGDGVDQDDYVTAAGAFGFEPAGYLRADRVTLEGVELPYIRFPRAPEE